MSIKCPNCQVENPDDSKFCKECATPLPLSEDISRSHTKTLHTPAKDLIKGTTFADRYRLIEELGRGGMGVVYKAEDTKLKRTVALKFLPPELTHIPDIKERFIREAQAAAALDHPNICTVYEFGEAEQKSFISMAYIKGQSLKNKIESEPIELEEAIQIATEIAEGLQEAHKKGVVHRDIKSSNIMMDERNQAKIMDFGLARKAGGTLLTKEGTAMGTIAYMSPEQTQAEEVDHRTDIWSFGVVLYEMLTRQLPFKGEHEQAVVYSIRKDKPKPITEINAEIPQSIEQVVDKALEKDADKRYQQVDELLDDLKSISAGIVPEEIQARLRKAKLHRRKRVFLYAGTVGLAIVLAVLALTLFTGPAEAIESIAVLPLQNLTGDDGKEYFVDGATDELIGQLSKIGAWNVKSRTTMMQYKGVDKSLPEIARELNVDALVEGTVFQVGENVRIRIQLFDVLPEEQNLWSETYERPMSEVRIMYSEVAQVIASELKIALTREEETRLAGARDVNPESYDAYLKGLSHHNKLTPEGLKLALQYYNLALELDPNNALAYLGVSGVWGIRYQFGMVPRQEAVPLMRTPIEKALELDNTLADAHSALAASKCFHEWDWKGAEKEFQQALRLNPNLSGAHSTYSHLLCIMGRKEEALPHIERALKLDPLSPLINYFYGMVLKFNGRLDDALAAYRTVQEMEPNFVLGFIGEANILGAKGMYDEALAMWRKVHADDAEIIAALDDGFEEAGYEGANRAVADLMAERYGKPGESEGLQSADDIAMWYQRSGDYEEAIDWFEKDYEEHSPSMPYIGLHGYLLRSYPRFQELLRKMNLPVDEEK